MLLQLSRASDAASILSMWYKLANNLVFLFRLTSIRRQILAVKEKVTLIKRGVEKKSIEIRGNRIFIDMLYGQATDSALTICVFNSNAESVQEINI